MVNRQWLSVRVICEIADVKMSLMRGAQHCITWPLWVVSGSCVSQPVMEEVPMNSRAGLSGLLLVLADLA